MLLNLIFLTTYDNPQYAVEIRGKGNCFFDYFSSLCPPGCSRLGIAVPIIIHNILGTKGERSFFPQIKSGAKPGDGILISLNGET